VSRGFHPPTTVTRHVAVMQISRSKISIASRDIIRYVAYCVARDANERSNNSLIIADARARVRLLHGTTKDRADRLSLTVPSIDPDNEA